MFNAIPSVCLFVCPYVYDNIIQSTAKTAREAWLQWVAYKKSASGYSGDPSPTTTTTLSPN